MVNRFSCAFAGLGILLGMGGSAAVAAVNFEVVAKSQPDEYYNGIGQPYVPLGNQAMDKKVNHDYAWNVTKTEQGQVWWGSSAGVYCEAAGNVALLTLSAPEAEETNYNVCEYGESQYPGIPNLLRTYVGDWRPPEIFSYDPNTHAVVDRTPDDPLIDSTLGFRSGGSVGNIVFFAGPRLNTFLGINIFAFNATNGRFLGSRTMWQYSNVRSWLAANGELYVGVKNSFGLRYAGTILKWNGSNLFPFRFQEVGKVNGEPSELALHEGRVFCSTWPVPGTNNAADGSPGVWMSPAIPNGGLRPIQRNGWTKVWSTDEYDPDPAISKSIAGGPLCSFDGYLYWGTIIFPGAGVAAWVEYYGVPDESQINDILNNSTRGAAVFRGRNFTSGVKEVELLYGDNNVQVYDPGTGMWTSTPTTQGDRLYGSAGFGNFFNFYIWSCAIYDGKLYFGTFDIGFSFYGDDYVDDPSIESFRHLGADLYCFSDSNSAAVRVDRDGLGNPTNHGARSMVGCPDGLYIGTANLANLLTDTGDSLPEGGWELLKMTEVP